MVEGEIGCDVMGETQSGSTVSMELTHVRKTFVGTWEGSASSRRIYDGTASGREATEADDGRSAAV